jgi:succinate dehydrogenase/fumarate reductase flavoprotein subunit
MVDDLTCDLVVVGSGAAGLSAAVTAAHLGLDVIVIEKEKQLGGTSAWSGGWLWVPRNPLAVAAGIVEDIEVPLSYLRSELGEGFDEPLARRFLTEAPRMIHFMLRNTAVDFIDGNAIPDFHDTSEGAANGGRSVCAAPYDGRRLGQRITDLKPPLGLIAPFGMGIAAGADLRHFFSATRAWASFWHVSKRVLRHVADLARYGRGMQLVAGNALVARLLRSADDVGVRILTATSARELTRDADGNVTGLITRDGHRITARRGVVLAAGGFPHDPKRKAAMFPHAPTGREHFSAASRGDTGDGLRLGETAGGTVRQDLSHAGAWAPVSLVPEADGGTGHFPHLAERAKPGLIMVREDGQRFGNEADSYHDLMQALFAATPPDESPACWMIADHAFQRRYGLGRARPRPFPLRHWIANGYLKRSQTIAGLGLVCGIDPTGLEATIARVNADAVKGQDSAYGRGSSAYNRIQGDPEQKPNPCVRPLGPGPFYGVRIVPGSLGTFAGLDTDIDARVLDSAGQPVPGLYAVGNDMASIMRGRYPAGGITLGPAMTFGYIAAHHAAGVPLDNNHTGESHAPSRP